MVTIVAGVSNSFGTRSSESDIAEAQAAAKTLANDVIGKVDGILNTLSGEGSVSLSSAVSAINALGDFSPKAVVVTYTPPNFVNAAFIVPSIFVGDPPAVTDLVEPPDIDLSGNVSSISIPGVAGAAPVIGDIVIAAAPSLPSIGGLPTAPADTPLTVPAAPAYTPPAQLTLPPLITPTLKDLDIPAFDFLPIPEYTPPLLPALPTAPELTINDVVPSDYISAFDINEDPVLVDYEGALIGPYVTRREVYQSVEVFRSRAQPVDEQAQFARATEQAQLMNSAELRKFRIDEATRDIATSRAVLTFLVQHDAILVEAALAFARAQFEVEALKADVAIQLMGAANNLYNAEMAKLAVEAEVYKTQIAANLGTLDMWRAHIEAAFAMVKANEQKGKIYALEIQGILQQAELYQAQVQALLANVEAYKAQMQTIAAAAATAKTSLIVYNSEVEAYQASLVGYKAQYDAYEVGTKALATRNQVEATKVQISVGELEAVGAELAKIVAELEFEATKLRAIAMNSEADYEQVKLQNSVEAIKAQIQGDIARSNYAIWATNAQITESKNDAVTMQAEAASRYFENASNSLYRASEQALRAVLASTQSASIAQEAAGKTAASVAQGAYSAVHVQASLQGGGSIAANESREDRVQSQFSDMLQYTESREQVLSA